MVTWAALGRYGVDPAPEGLAFVQDLLATVAAGGKQREDLLADLATAQDWLGGALAAWAEAAGTAPVGVTLAHDDLEQLRGFRDDLHRLVAASHDGTHDGVPPHSVALPTVALGSRWDEAGRVRLLPRGSGWRKVASVVAVEMFSAQRDGTWERLKTCRNSRCGVPFYDRSRNNGGVWHDVKVCGNAANLRAYRARRRLRQETV
ncbi:CGNR zinc finger domain-containing protein [Actinacidiphila rubida]|uniref:Putative stress-induced transcription regulator n=1 Tax=Actinacidiphila rubida TaxID=310780 RepID=A0A1H8JC10_9ACTN|nr:CGNR zinc finger domain-containing protein [Actinacidiphila rubida]SEN77727.1 Putative stress-induced transcription regulator [Actinacidiphila rubida]